MRTNRIIIICGVILVGFVILLTLRHTKTAGWYLDHIVELRQEKQDLLDKVSDIDKQILEYRKVMDEKQFTGLNYLSTGSIETGIKALEKELNLPPETTTSFIPKAKADYQGETEYERARNQIIKLGVDYEIAEHITREAYANTSGAKEFIRNIIGVSNAESSIFQKCDNGHNNCLGVMQNGTLKYYNNLKESITDRRVKRNKNRWIVRKNANQWLKGNYCASECSTRITNYNDGILKLGI